MVMDKCRKKPSRHVSFFRLGLRLYRNPGLYRSSRDARFLALFGFCLGLVVTLCLPPVVAGSAARPWTKKIVAVLVGFLISWAPGT